MVFLQLTLMFVGLVCHLHEAEAYVCHHYTVSECVFPCHCAYYRNNPDVHNQCYTSGTCNQGCNPYYRGTYCQEGNVALNTETDIPKTVIQSMTADGNNLYAIDTSPATCTTSTIDSNSRTFLQVNLTHEHVVNKVQVYSERLHRATLQGVRVLVTSTTEYWKEEEDGFCWDFPLDTTVGTTIEKTCTAPKKGKYVTIESTYGEELVLCEMKIDGYFYYDCEKHLVTGYHYGPACMNKCYCETQCDFITGSCSGSCMSGYHTTTSEMICEACPANTWGKDCANWCFCSGDSTCDATTGVCDSCADQYVGVSCDIHRGYLMERSLEVVPDGQDITFSLPGAPNNTFVYYLQYRRPNAMSTEGTAWVSANLEIDHGRMIATYSIPDEKFFANTLYEIRLGIILNETQFGGPGALSRASEFMSGCKNKMKHNLECKYWCEFEKDDFWLKLTNLDCGSCHNASNEECYMQVSGSGYALSVLQSSGTQIKLALTTPVQSHINKHIIRYYSLQKEQGYTTIETGSGGEAEVLLVNLIEDSQYEITAQPIVMHNNISFESYPIISLTAHTKKNGSASDPFIVALVVALVFGAMLLGILAIFILWHLRCKNNKSQESKDAGVEYKQPVEPQVSKRKLPVVPTKDDEQIEYELPSDDNVRKYDDIGIGEIDTDWSDRTTGYANENPYETEPASVKPNLD